MRISKTKINLLTFSAAECGKQESNFRNVQGTLTSRGNWKPVKKLKLIETTESRLSTVHTLGSGVEARFPSLSRGRASFPPESSRERARAHFPESATGTRACGGSVTSEYLLSGFGLSCRPLLLSFWSAFSLHVKSGPRNPRVRRDSIPGNLYEKQTPEVRFSALRSPRFWGSGYCTKGPQPVFFAFNTFILTRFHSHVQKVHSPNLLKGNISVR